VNRSSSKSPKGSNLASRNFEANQKRNVNRKRICEPQKEYSGFFLETEGETIRECSLVDGGPRPGNGMSADTIVHLAQRPC
jgi:hypothetical protein